MVDRTHAIHIITHDQCIHHSFLLILNQWKINHVHNYDSAIISLTYIYVAVCIAFAKMNVRFTDRLTKNDRKRGVLIVKGYVEV